MKRQCMNSVSNAGLSEWFPDAVRNKQHKRFQTDVRDTQTNEWEWMEDVESVFLHEANAKSTL